MSRNVSGSGFEQGIAHDDEILGDGAEVFAVEFGVVEIAHYLFNLANRFPERVINQAINKSVYSGISK